MRIAILCTDPRHPVMSHLRAWATAMRERGHDVSLHTDRAELEGGDLLFLVSASQLIPKILRDRFASTLVLHASDLPKGRGWSPHVWSVIEGANEFVVCLLEADDPVDSGRVWKRERVVLEGHELLDEINEKLFATELSLMTFAVEKRGNVQPEPQSSEAPTYRRRRSSADSELDAQRTIAEQFNLLRVVDNQRYPAYFRLHGHTYVLKITKAESDDDV